MNKAAAIYAADKKDEDTSEKEKPLNHKWACDIETERRAKRFVIVTIKTIRFTSRRASHITLIEKQGVAMPSGEGQILYAPFTERPYAHPEVKPYDSPLG